MNYFGIDFLKEIGLLTKNTSIRKGFTDKPNANLNIQRLYAGMEDKYETKIEIEEIDYKIPVITDFTLFAWYKGNSEDRSDYLLWKDWLENKRILYVLSNDKLIKIESLAQLRAYLPFINTPSSSDQIKERMSELGIASDKVEVIDCFKSELIKKKLRKIINKSYYDFEEYTPETCNTVDLSSLAYFELSQIEPFVISLKNRPVTLDLVDLEEEHAPYLNLFFTHQIPIVGLWLDKGYEYFTKNISSTYTINNIKNVEICEGTPLSVLDFIKNLPALSQLTVSLSSWNDEAPEEEAEKAVDTLHKIYNKLTILRIQQNNYIAIDALKQKIPENLVEFEFQAENDGDAAISECFFEIFHSEGSNKLQKLSTKANLFVATNDNALSGFPNLTHLALGLINPIKPSLKFLKTLYIEGIRYDEETNFVDFISQSPELEELYLYDVSFMEDSNNLINNKKLKKISCEKTWVNLSIISELCSKNSETLEYLDFEYHGGEVFNTHKVFSNLTHLGISFDTGYYSNVYISDGNMRRFLNLSPLLNDFHRFLTVTPNLQYLNVALNMENNPIHSVLEELTPSYTVNLKYLIELSVEGVPLEIIYPLVNSSPLLKSISYNGSFPSFKSTIASKNNTTLMKANFQGKKALVNYSMIAPRIFENFSLDYFIDDNTPLKKNDQPLRATHLSLSINSIDTLLKIISNTYPIKSLNISKTKNFDMSEANITHFRELESLTIESAEIENSKELVSFLNLSKNLKYLVLDNVTIQNIDINSFKDIALPKLESIIFINTSFWQTMIKFVNNISHLSIDDEQFYPNQLKNLLNRLPRLAYLSLSADGIEDATELEIENEKELEKALKKYSTSIRIKDTDRKEILCGSNENISQTILSPSTNASSPTFYPIEYFIPKQNNKISTSQYRLNVHHKPAYVNKKEINFEYLDAKITPLTEEELNSLIKVNAIRKLYLETYHHTANVHYGYCPLLLSSKTWKFLPSLSPNEQLIGIKCHQDIIIGYCQEKNLYAVKLKESIPEDEYIVEILLDTKLSHLKKLSAWELAEYRSIGEKILDVIQFHINQKNALTINIEKIKKAISQFRDEYSRLSDLVETMSNHPFYRGKLSSASLPQSDIELLLYSLFETFKQFGQGNLTGKTDTALDLLHTLSKERKGACRHRASLFKIIFDVLIPHINARLISNESHAFIEIKNNNENWITVDLGGYPANVINQPTYTSHTSGFINKNNSKKEPTVMTMDGDTSFVDPLVTETSGNVLADDYAFYSDSEEDDTKTHSTHKAPMPCEISPDNPYVTWKIPTQQQIFTDFFSSLLQNLQAFSLGQKNILLTFDNENRLKNFNEAVMHFQRQKKCKHYYLNSLNDIKFTVNQVTQEGNLRGSDSGLSVFLKEAQLGDVLLINWSDFKPKHIGYNTIVDTQKRRLENLRIPRGVIVIVLIEKSKASSLREDFYSRFRIKSHIDARMSFNISFYNPLWEEHNALLESEYRYSAWEDDNWEKDLLMEISPGANHKVSASKGHLLRAVQEKKKTLVIINPPKNDSLTLFITEAMTKRHVFINGETVALPDDFEIKFKTEKYDWSGNYQVETLNETNFPLCTDILTSDNFNQYFHTYYFENGYLNKKPGWLEKLSSNAHILVTDTLSNGEWAKLLYFMRQTKIKPTFVFTLNAKIPNEMLELSKHAITNQTVSDDARVATDMDYIEAKTSSRASYIVSQEPLLVINQEFKEKADLIMTANPDMGYEIVETLEKTNREIDSLQVKHTLGVLAQYLCEGKQVIFQIYDDALTKELETSLSSLFLAKPYLSINGEKKDISGSIVFICNNDQYFNFLNEKRHQECHTETNVSNLSPHENIQMRDIENISKSYEEHAAEIAEMSKKNPCVFLIGPTGTGKSTMVLKTLPQYLNKQGYQTKVFVGLEKLSAWANATADCPSTTFILFIDEANLLPKGSLEIFEDMYHDNPGIVIKGQYIPLSENHRVILAGNNLNYVGRINHLFTQRHDCFYEVPPLASNLLEDTYIKPYIKNEALAKKAADVFLMAYEMINKDENSCLLTPRNLKNMSSKLSLRLSSPFFDGPSLSVDQFIWLSCYDEIRYYVSPKTKEKFKAKMLMALPDYKVLKKKIAETVCSQVKLPDYALTHTSARRLLLQHLILREHLIQQNDTEAPFSMSGLFFIGMPGIGKSSMVENCLKHKGISFTFMRATTKDEAEALLTKAFRAGEVVVIDELNTMPFLEYSLNAFTMGVDLEGKSAAKKGFLVIGTGNPISFGGRYALSPALENRFLTIKLKDYKKEDLMLIGKTCKLNESVVEKHVTWYLAAKDFAETYSCSPQPSARDIINSFHALSSTTKSSNTSPAKQPRSDDKDQDHEENPTFKKAKISGSSSNHTSSYSNGMHVHGLFSQTSAITVEPSLNQYGLVPMDLSS